MSDPVPVGPSVVACVALFSDNVAQLTGERPRSVALPRAVCDRLIEELKDFCNLREASRILGEEPTLPRVAGVLCTIAKGE